MSEKLEKKEEKEFRDFFPILKKRKKMIYLDSAATSLKLENVIKNIENYYRLYSFNIHNKNSNFLFKKINETVKETRKLISQKINAEIDEIIFAPSATFIFSSLGLLLSDSLKEGDEICLTYLEHSSNLYPWLLLEKEKKIKLVFLPLDKNFIIDLSNIEKHISKKTKIVSFFHISNSLGTINNVEKITQIIKKINNNCLVIVDACQSINNTKIDVKKMKIDILIFSGHKIYGPTGIGVIWKKKDSEEIKWVSNKKISLTFIKSFFETGTLPIAQIFGLKASFEFIKGVETSRLIKYKKDILRYALNNLKKIEKIKIYNEKTNSNNIITFNIENIHSHDVVDYLGKKGIIIRGDNFCCLFLSKVILDSSALRISLEIYNNYDEIDKFINILRFIIKRPACLVLT